MTVYNVHVYPWDDTPDSADWFFESKEDAQAFADHINSQHDGNWLSGGHDEVIVFTVEPTPLSKALEEVEMYAGPCEAGR